MSWFQTWKCIVLELWQFWQEFGWRYWEEKKRKGPEAFGLLVVTGATSCFIRCSARSLIQNVMSDHVKRWSFTSVIQEDKNRFLFISVYVWNVGDIYTENSNCCFIIEEPIQYSSFSQSGRDGFIKLSSSYENNMERTWLVTVDWDKVWWTIRTSINACKICSRKLRVGRTFLHAQFYIRKSRWQLYDNLIIQTSFHVCWSAVWWCKYV